MERQPLIRRFWADQRGATAIEYGMIAGLMTVVVIGIASTGGALDAIYEKVREIVIAMGGG